MTATARGGEWEGDGGVAVAGDSGYTTNGAKGFGSQACLRHLVAPPSPSQSPKPRSANSPLTQPPRTAADIARSARIRGRRARPPAMDWVGIMTWRRIGPSEPMRGGKAVEITSSQEDGDAWSLDREETGEPSGESACATHRQCGEPTDPNQTNKNYFADMDP
nr:unnamed protein product [Digitaria exilis]